MMRVLILRNTVCGGVAVDAGSIVEASEQDALILMRMGKAVAAPTLPKVKGVETADQAPGETAVRRVPKKGKRGG